MEVDGDREVFVMSNNDYDPRPYQVELLEAAIEKNTIVLLGTGAGKTFIAVMLIKQLASPIAIPLSERAAKRTVFLVNTVPLVSQQADYIEKHIPLDVGRYYGEMGVDGWSARKWTEEFEKFNILVMTRQIFLDVLIHNFIHISKINLIVFDECHHAVKKDPYVRIMTEFYFKCNDAHRPHILGLSASIISGKCRPGELKKKLKELEVTLNCRVETASDLAEVAKYATDPDEVLLRFDSRPASSKALVIRRRLEDLLKFLDYSVTATTNKKPKKQRRDTDVRNIIEECLEVLDDVSMSSALEAANFAEAELHEMLQNSLTEWERGLVAAARTEIAIFVQECQKELDNGADDRSPKLTTLLDVLSQAFYGGLFKQDEKVCGIIFVQKRSTAVCLSEMINSLKDGLFPQVKCGYIVGHGSITGGQGQGSTNMNTKKQQEVLRRFRKEALNLLVATSVVEEGLDVRRCNLVVRYSFPQTFQSYVQSKGRARSKNSRYLLLVDDEEYAKCREKLHTYRDIEKELQSICHDRTVPEEDEIELRLKHRCPPYLPFGEDGPRLSVDGSLSLLHKYCQKLPHDQYTFSAPTFTFENIGLGVCFLDEEWYDPMYVVEVGLPMNCPIRAEIKGPALPSLSLAKKAAALATLEKLHREGELNDHLKPIYHKEIDSDEEDQVKMKKKGEEHAGTTKRNIYYRNQVASCLLDSQPSVVDHLGNIYLYVFIMTHKDTKNPYRSKGGRPFKTMGVLTGKPLPYHKIPEFSLYIGRSEVSVSIVKQPISPISDSDLQKYRNFHLKLFTQVLKINKFQSCFDQPNEVSRGYLVLPVSVTELETSFSCSIDIDLVDYVLTFGAQAPKWPCQLERYQDALVSKSYTQEIVRDQPRLYEVTQINPHITPHSAFPPDPSITYSDYFLKKYNYKFRYFSQPSLTCKPVSTSEKKLQLSVSRFKEEDSDGRKMSEIVLFPELCNIHHLKADTLYLFQCVPSLLHRMESLLLVEEFSCSVIKETGIGLSSCQKKLFTTIIPVRADLDTLFFSSSSACYPNYHFSLEEKPIIINNLMDAGDDVIRAPNGGLLLQALTPVSANDCINLERLETLGDSFLKLATSINLFCSRGNHHEGKLTMARVRRISNFNLCYLANKRDIPRNVFSQKFEPLSTWIPPCYSPADIEGPPEVSPSELPEDKLKALYHKVPDKWVADSVEALIGAYLIAGGIEAGFKFLQFLGLKMDGPSEDVHPITRDVTMSTTRSPSQESLMSINSYVPNIPPLLVQNSITIFQKFCQPPPPSVLKEGDHSSTLSDMTATCGKLCDKLSWEFSDKGLLLQALTHPSYVKNSLTHCYQRLEFLGDAILDYLITCYIYHQFPDYSPGKITEMRSALVNNVTFAEIAVKELELHKHLLYTSPALFRQIKDYTEGLEMVWKEDEDEIKSILLCRSEYHPSMKLNKPLTNSFCDATMPPEPPSSDIAENNQAGVAFQENSGIVEEIEEITPPKALGDVLESIAGALFLDSDMSLEIVWLKFYPFFKPLIEKYSNEGLPIPPIQELDRLGHSLKIEVHSDSRHGKNQYRCTIKVVDKGIQVSALSKTQKQARNAAGRRVLEILKHKHSEQRNDN